VRSLIELAKRCCSIEEFAEKVGWHGDLLEFEEYVEEHVDGITAIVRYNGARVALQEATTQVAVVESRFALFKARWRMWKCGLVEETHHMRAMAFEMLKGLDLGRALLCAPPRRPSAIKATGRKRNLVIPTGDGQLAPVPPELIECVLMQPDVLGFTSATFHDRPVIKVRMRSMVDGGPYGRQKTSHMLLTLHNGLINHAELTEPVSCAWIIQDLWAEAHGPDHQGTFTKQGIITAGVAILGEAARLRLKNQFNILKQHIYHPSKRWSGYSYAIDDIGTELTIRPRRKEDENSSAVKAVAAVLDVFQRASKAPVGSHENVVLRVKVSERTGG